MSASWHPVSAVGDLLDGQKAGMEIHGRRLVFCRTKDGLFALDGTCTHGFALMDEGRLRGNRLICPLHGASFDCRTGVVLGAPATVPLQTYATRISADGVIEVQLPD